MSNQIATIVSPCELTVSRETKSGKEVVRGLMGLMSSGNKAEKAHALDQLVSYHWSNNQFKPIMREFSRVFGGKDFDKVVDILDIQVDRPNKLAMLALFGALVKGTKGKTLKGEKAVYHGYAVDLLAQANASQLTGAALDAALKEELAQIE